MMGRTFLRGGELVQSLDHSALTASLHVTMFNVITISYKRLSLIIIKTISIPLEKYDITASRI